MPVTYYNRAALTIAPNARRGVINYCRLPDPRDRTDAVRRDAGARGGRAAAQAARDKTTPVSLSQPPWSKSDD